MARVLVGTGTRTDQLGLRFYSFAINQEQDEGERDNKDSSFANHTNQVQIVLISVPLGKEGE